MQIESNEWTPEERETEAALRALSPTAAALDRGALMYEAGAAAGRAAAQRTLWAWKAAACVGMVACVALAMVRAPGAERSGGTLAHIDTDAGRAAPVIPRLAEVPAVSMEWLIDTGASEGSPWAYRQLMNAVAEGGMEAMPTSPNGDASDPRILRADGKPVLLLNGRIAEGGSL